MAIQLKNLCESNYMVHVKPEGTTSIESMGELASWLNRKIIDPLKKKMNPDEPITGQHYPIMSDGSSFHDPYGNIKVFVGMFPDKWRPRILGGVSHFLDQIGAKHSNWELVGKDYQDDKRFVNIQVDLTKPQAPKIVMSNGALQMIMDLLEIGTSYQYGGHFTMKIPAQELHDRIEEYFSNAEGGISPLPQNTKIRAYLNEMKSLCKWAINHGIKTIEAH